MRGNCKAGSMHSRIINAGSHIRKDFRDVLYVRIIHVCRTPVHGVNTKTHTCIHPCRHAHTTQSHHTQHTHTHTHTHTTFHLLPNHTAHNTHKLTLTISRTIPAARLAAICPTIPWDTCTPSHNTHTHITVQGSPQCTNRVLLVNVYVCDGTVVELFLCSAFFCNFWGHKK